LNNTNVEITYNDDHVLIKRIYETYKKWNLFKNIKNSKFNK
jgi:hypothetical protein